MFADIEQKRRTTAYLHARPLLLEPVPELAPLRRAVEDGFGLE